MSRRWPRCEACGRAFRPDRHNIHTQQYCTREDCKLARKRRRQRQWYAQKCRDDPAFQRAERERCAAANRARRAREKTEARAREASATVEPIGADLSAVVTGLLCQLTDSHDPTVIRNTARHYRERGREVAACAAGLSP